MRLYLFPSQSARPTPNSKPQSITGRDSYIIAEALYRYIATEQAKLRTVLEQLARRHSDF